MGTVLHQWIEDTLNKSYDRKNGSIAVEDGAKKTVRTIEFHRTLIESIVLPSLDKARKDTEFLKLKLIPENLKFGNTGEKLDQKKAIKYGTPQPFDRGHFKLTITGLATECAAVSKIDSITIKQGTTADATGDQRSPHIEPTRLDESHLVIILPMSSAKGFLDWQQKTIEDGMASSNETKSGSLQYFAIGSTSSRFVFNFDGLGLASMSATKETDKNNNKDAKFALYYSSVALQAN
jgi:hypothetical protein